MWLRQSTASQEIKLGAFLDSTDGNTAETGLTIANTDIKLTKGGATTETNKNSGGATHVAGGRYSAVLDATDTDTLGILEVDVHVSGALAVHRSYLVVPAVVYDAIVLGTDSLDVNVAQWLGTAVATPTVAGVPEVDLTHMAGGTQTVTDLKDFADAGYDPATNKVQGVVLVDTTTTNTDMRGTDSALLATSAPTNFGDLAITVTTGQVTVGTNNDKTGYTASTVSDKTGYSLSASQTFDVTGNLSGSVGSVTGAVGSVTGAVGSVTGNVGGNVAGSVASVTGNVDGNVTGSVASNLELGPAEVNAEVVDALNVDTYAEPGQGAPAATTSLVAKINYLYKAWRNKTEQTATTTSLYDDAGTTVDQKAMVSDDGTTFIKGEQGTGP